MEASAIEVIQGRGVVPNDDPTAEQDWMFVQLYAVVPHYADGPHGTNPNIWGLSKSGYHVELPERPPPE
jgi:hypothetical protein